MSKETLSINSDTFLTLFQVLRGFLETFLTLQARRSGKTFLDFWGISGPEGLETLVCGGSDRKTLMQKQQKKASRDVGDPCFPRSPTSPNDFQC